MSNQEPAFHRDQTADGYNGMTLRDYFAAKALPLAIAHWRLLDAAEDGGGVFAWSFDEITSDCHAAAELSYTMADAMMAARERA